MQIIEEGEVLVAKVNASETRMLLQAAMSFRVSVCSFLMSRALFGLTVAESSDMMADIPEKRGRQVVGETNIYSHDGRGMHAANADSTLGLHRCCSGRGGPSARAGGSGGGHCSGREPDGCCHSTSIAPSPCESKSTHENRQAPLSPGAFHSARNINLRQE